MKKLVSVLLLTAMLATLLLPVISASAAGEAVVPSASYNFDDYVDYFAPPNDKFATMTTKVVSVNGNPATALFALKGTGNWNHATIPFKFQKGQIYVVSYDVAVIEQSGKSTLSNATLLPYLCCSAFSSEASGLTGAWQDSSDPSLGLTFNSGSDGTVKPGQWTRTTFTVAVSNGFDADSLGFREVPTDSNGTFLIDNLVIMEKSQYEAAYPNGIAARTDDPSLGYDRIVADFNDNRYTALRTYSPSTGRVSVTVMGDSVLNWNRTKSSEAPNEVGLYIPFNFKAGKTYRVAFDVSKTTGAAATFSLVASATQRADDANAALQTFKTANDVTSVTLNDATWTRVDMTLTPTADAKYFILALDAATIASTNRIYFDNFALTEASAFPTDLQTRTADVDKVLRETFDNGTGVFHNAWFSSRVDLPAEVVNIGGLQSSMLNWRATTSGACWNRIIGYYAFDPSVTYVVSFDIYYYGIFAPVKDADNNVIGEELRTEDLPETEIAIYSVAQDFSKFNDGANHGGVKLQGGQWIHYTKTLTMPNTDNLDYFGLIEFPNHGIGNGCFYIDNFTIAPKTAECTDTTHVAGVWSTAEQFTCEEKGSMKLTCAICGTQMDTKEVPAGEHMAGEWIETKGASCSEEGSRHKLCTVCGDEVTVEPIPKLAHTPAEQWTVEKEAEIGVDGYRYKLCTVCNQKVQENTIPALPNISITTSEPTTTVGNATEETPATEAPTAPVEEAGCASSIGAGCLVLAGVMTLAGVMLGKKKTF